MFRQKSHNNFSGKFGKIRAKILRIPNNLLTPTPMPLRKPVFTVIYHDYLLENVTYVCSHTCTDICLGNWLKIKYCACVLDGFWSGQWVVVWSYTALTFTFCFYLYLNDDVRSRFMYTEACWTFVSFSTCLFACLFALGSWNGLARRGYCVMLSRSWRGLHARKCFKTQFGMDF